ncbi:molybdenum ABC transporter ATP-binding protein [Mangrovibacterium diazotrophicum]|uniref:Molybdate transport system ATP-binding protein n=1 Tax=Mangrovibacterium diazotrophicum TaxID=1261403 RepID=A0A419W2G6_9BACT|nr:molybdenum ABC transporter ATP-binding protein [Mangrovibacterium diazotrophicum]RKD89675.1 molybdate transport system ATP-binding protein [Mangrovibacterium diazotrophicum]
MIQVNIQLKRDNFDVLVNETFGMGITGIFGPSGSGKTSLMNSICGLAKPEKGSISINGKKVFSLDEKLNIPVEKRRIGYVFQEGRLFPHLSVEKNLRYGMTKQDSSGLFNKIVTMLNLGHLLKSKPAKISGGERQRTALGRALLSSPEILLLDEPFSALDANLRQQILPFLLKIHQSFKIPMLVVSHDITDLLKLTNNICLMQSGRVIGHGEYHELVRKPNLQHIFSRHSLINAISMTVSRVDMETGITQLSYGDSHNWINVVIEKSRLNYCKGDQIKIFISSDDIALSAKRLPSVTIQNQLDGVVREIIERENLRLCIVDVGFPLLVEITAESAKRMDIEVGYMVWCLFKSVAIDVAG